MRYLILFLTTGLMGCAGSNFANYIDPELKPYVDTYAAYKMKYTGKTYSNNIVVFFYDRKLPTIADCSIGGGFKIVRIDPTFWNQTSESRKELIIFHELGHCDLKINHSTTQTIMSPNLLNEFYYEVNRETLIEKLFIDGV